MFLITLIKESLLWFHENSQDSCIRNHLENCIVIRRISKFMFVQWYQCVFTTFKKLVKYRYMYMYMYMGKFACVCVYMRSFSWQNIKLKSGQKFNKKAQRGEFCEEVYCWQCNCLLQKISREPVKRLHNKSSSCTSKHAWVHCMRA